MSVSLLLASFAAAVHPHDTPTPVVEPARARANLASYVSASDYPASALRERAEGTTGFTLDVGADGRVAGCTITASSGSAALDAAACSIMRRRARFTPARDSYGNPATDTVRSRLVWHLPAPPVPAATAPPVAAGPGPLRLIVTVGPAGEVTDCRPLTRGESELGQHTCAAIRERARRGEDVADGGR